MKIMRAALGLFLGAALFVGLPGCEPADSSGEKLDSLPASGANGGPAPKNQEDYRKQQQGQQKPGSNPYGQDYPGGQGAPGR
jgi:hypothetical protein